MIRLSLGTASPRAVLQAYPWRDEAGRNLTIAAKVTLDLEREGPYDGQVGARTPGVTAAFPSPPDPETAEAAPPLLPLAQITLRGHARCPLGKSDLMSRARLVVRRGAITLLDKTVLVHGDRAHPGGLPAPFTEMPLVHERAARSAWNPIGRAMQLGDPPANLVSNDPSRPFAAFAPVPATWPSRLQLLAGQGAPAAVGPMVRSGFDRRYYLDAPHDQWLEHLAPGDVVEIEGVSARHARLRVEVPAWTVVAAARGPQGWAVDVPLLPATLAIDADREIAMITWRGATAVPPAAADDATVVVSVATRAASAAVTAAMRPIDLDEHTHDGSLLVRQPTMPFARVTHAAHPPVALQAGVQAVGRAPVQAPPPAPPLPAPPPLHPPFDVTYGSDEGEPTFAPPAMMISLSALPPAPTLTPLRPEREETGVLAIPSGERDPAPPALLAAVIEAPLVEPSRVAENTEKLLAGTLGGEALRAADLAGAELAGADLSGRDLRAARMAGAKLDGAKLDGARFDGADLSGAQLRGARLRGASLVTTRLEDADLEGADLERANLSLGQLSRARFDRALLRSSVLEGACADGASFRGADLASSSGQGLRMRDADLVGARLTEIDWPSADLDGSDLSDTLLARAMLPEALLSGAKLEGADLRGASLRKASLQAARCQGARFDGADLQGVDATLAVFDDDALARARTVGMKR